MPKRNSLLLFLAVFLPSIAWADKIPLKDRGAWPVDWEKLGTITGRGTAKFKYKIKDRPAFAKAMGEGLYPNSAAIMEKNRDYGDWLRKNPNPDAWSHVGTGDPKADFYAWVSAKDVGPGAKLLFTAKALEAGGEYKQALKAYYDAVLNFADEAVQSADHTFVWYVGPAALDGIETITNRHPEIGYRLEGARIKVTNGEDIDTKNDIVEVDPGKWVKYKQPKSVDLTKMKVVGHRGMGKVQAVQYENGHWQLLKDGKPYVVKGITYSPVPVGETISEYNLKWMSDDADENGRADAPYDAWVDANGNGRQDDNEPSVGDFKIMKDMGVNTIRLYRTGEGAEYDPSFADKKVLRDLYNTYGISVIMGDFLGAYTIGSGAKWEDGTDYTDPVQLENMRRVIREYVLDHRQEPYVLMWLIGNENLMPSDYSGVNATRTKAAKQVEAYLRFVNEIADLIHRLDPEHPVAVGNLGLLRLDEYAKFAPSVDIFGCNLYLGSSGFGSNWRRVKDTFDRPLLITEYGCDAWDSRAKIENEKAQADYHEGNWDDIRMHLAGGPTSEGNAIGGVLFEYLDEWWKSKDGSTSVHDTTSDSPMAFPDGWSSEEWLGVVSRGDGKDNDLRRPREAYLRYKNKLWK